MRAKDRPLSRLQALLVFCAVLILGGLSYGIVLAAKHLRQERAASQAIPIYLDELKMQMERLSGVIEKYRTQFGFYPANRSANGTNLARVNPLYYELVGTRWSTNYQTFEIPTAKQTITPDRMEAIFGIRSFSNTAMFPAWPTNFITEVSFPRREENEISLVGSSPPDAMTEEVESAFTISSWRYAADPAEHNRGKFDLWIEVDVSGKRFVVKNWDTAP